MVKKVLCMMLTVLGVGINLNAQGGDICSPEGYRLVLREILSLSKNVLSDREKDALNAQIDRISLSDIDGNFLGATGGSSELMNALLEIRLFGADILISSLNHDEVTLLHCLLRWGKRGPAEKILLEQVKILLTAGADVNAHDKRHDLAPLHVEILQNGNSSELVKILIEAGANVNAKQSIEGSTPLYVAAGLGKPESMQALIAAGAKMEAFDFGGQTFLHGAVGVSGRQGFCPDLDQLLDQLFAEQIQQAIEDDQKS